MAPQSVHTVVYATTNQGKLTEATLIGKQFGVRVVGLKEVAALTPVPDVAETGETYEENSLIKAIAYREWSGQSVVADDAGLEVAALNGAPGVYSARFGGVEISWPERRELLLKTISGAKDRSAQFVCVVTLVDEGMEPLVERGTLNGSIAEAPRGDAGFGYDCLFLVGDTGKTLAELKAGGTVVETHRKKAFHALLSRMARGVV